jgi:uncharacterized phage protein gp47/JayE
MAGMTITGFQIKSLDEIRQGIADNVRINMGADIDVSPSSRIGQFIDIVSNEIFLAWQGLEAIYNSFYPDTASGTSLDNVAAITNTVRKAATSAQAQVFFGGAAGTPIPVGTLFEKTGTGRTFSNPTNEELISDQAMLLLASGIATSGAITLRYDIDHDTVINWNDDPATIKANILTNVPTITDLEVLGQLNITGAVHIRLITHTLPDTTPSVLNNTLANAAAALTATVKFSNEESALLLATQFGALTVPLRSIASVVSNITGLDQVINLTEGAAGTDRETDAQLRERRVLELQKVGSATIGGIKEAVANVQDVTNVSIIENDSSITDADGRPPHSFEVFVTGGDDDVIAQTIYDSKPVGINVVSTVAPTSQRTGTITDVNGNSQTLTFSSPDPVPMQVTINITIDALLFPTDGVQQIKDAILAYFDTLELGDDVLNHMLYSPVNTVPGIITLQILQTKVVDATPSTSNTVIDQTEVAQITDAQVLVNIS